MRRVFITGATGYMGRELSARLAARGHVVRALARRGSEHRTAAGCETVIGDALDGASYTASVLGCDTLVHLVGVAHPAPSKAAQFREVDLRSVRAAVAAASDSRVESFVYVSVAHPAPVMKAYIAARVEAEELVRAAGFRATILRPWYVLGPGHRWPLLLVPVYRLLEMAPSTREAAKRLALVTLPQIVEALVHAVENPPSGVRVMEVPEIRRLRQETGKRETRQLPNPISGLDA